MTRKFERIALIRLGSLGDIVHALPVAHRLRSEFPDAYIAWVVEAQYSKLLEEYKGIDEVIVLNTRNWHKGIIEKPWGEIRQAVSKLRKAKFDLVLDLQGLLKSGLAVYFTGAKYRLGFSRKYCRESLSACFTNEHVVPKQDETHIIEKNLAFVRHLGLQTTPWEFGLPTSATDVRYIDKFLADNGVDTGLIGINPGAGWITKRWSVERYACLADRLIEDSGLRVVFTWGPGERELAEEIAGLMKHSPLVACPTSVTQVIELIRRCRLFVAADTGPLHLADALGVSCIALYGPSDPLRNGPYGEGHVIVHHKLECSACFKRRCSDFKCMELITVDEVWAAAKSLLTYRKDK